MSNQGTVKHWDQSRGFRFLRTSDGDQFFHVSEFRGDQDSIEEGLEVEFELGQGRDGRPCAVNMRPANAAAALVLGDR